ncbi:hypothetical protein J7K52_05265 [Candidatus Bathyarchaeota archaeon]|nr:hypothetical protein [Candidatus Bathyarchaeota archaeon]
MSKDKVIRLKSWEEFKRLAKEVRPRSIVYNIEQSVPARELTSLRLILPTQGVQYVLLDFPKKGKLRETGISLHKGKNGNHYLKDEDIIDFVKKELDRDDVIVCSYWTI